MLRTKTIISKADKEILERLDYSDEQIKKLTSALAAKEKIEWIEKNHTRATEKPYELTHDEIFRIISVHGGQKHIETLLNLFNDLKSKNFNKGQIITIAAQHGGSNALNRINTYASVLLDIKFSHAQLTKIASRAKRGDINIKTLHELYFNGDEQTKKFENLQLTHKDVTDMFVHNGYHSNITKLIEYYNVLADKKFADGEKFTYEEIISIAKTNQGGSKIEALILNFNNLIKIAPNKKDIIDILNHAQGSNVIQNIITLYDNKSHKFTAEEILAIAKTRNNTKKFTIMASREQYEFLLKNVGLEHKDIVDLLKHAYGSDYIKYLIDSNAYIKDGKIEIDFKLTLNNKLLIVFFNIRGIEVIKASTNNPVSLEKEGKQAYQMFYSALYDAVKNGKENFSIVNFPNILVSLNTKDKRAQIGLSDKTIDNDTNTTSFTIKCLRKAKEWLKKNEGCNLNNQTAETQVTHLEINSNLQKRTADELDEQLVIIEPQAKRKKDNISSVKKINIPTPRRTINTSKSREIFEKIIIAFIEAIKHGKNKISVEFSSKPALAKQKKELSKKNGIRYGGKSGVNVYTFIIENEEKFINWLNTSCYCKEIIKKHNITIPEISVDTNAFSTSRISADQNITERQQTESNRALEYFVASNQEINLIPQADQPSDPASYSYDALFNSDMPDFGSLQSPQHMSVEQLDDDVFLQLLAGEYIDGSLFESLEKGVEDTDQTRCKFDSAHYVPTPDVSLPLLSLQNQDAELKEFYQLLSTDDWTLPSSQSRDTKDVGFFDTFDYSATSNPLSLHSFWRRPNSTEAKNNSENKQFGDSPETTSPENISSNPTQKKSSLWS